MGGGGFCPNSLCLYPFLVSDKGPARHRAKNTGKPLQGIEDRRFLLFQSDLGFRRLWLFGCPPIDISQSRQRQKLLYWFWESVPLLGLVHHRSRSQIASDQQSRPITDTSIAMIPAERAAFFMSDRHSIAITIITSIA